MSSVSIVDFEQVIVSWAERNRSKTNVLRMLNLHPLSRGNIFQNVDINCLSCIESCQFSPYFGSDASFIWTVFYYLNFFQTSNIRIIGTRKQ